MASATTKARATLSGAAQVKPVIFGGETVCFIGSNDNSEYFISDKTGQHEIGYFKEAPDGRCEGNDYMSRGFDAVNSSMATLIIVSQWQFSAVVTIELYPA